MIAVYILLGLTAGVLVFSVFPSIIYFFLVFSSNRRASARQAYTQDPRYARHRPALLSALTALEGAGLREVETAAGDGTYLTGLYLDAGAARTAVFLHGYHADLLESFALIGRKLRQEGYNLLFIRQRGHGCSGGRHTFLGLREQDDLLRWLGWLKETTQTKRVLLHGVSMGCATIGYASHRLPDDLVGVMLLDCGYTSPFQELQSDLSRRHIPWQLMLPLISALARLCYHVNLKTPVREALRQTHIPAVFLHGTADRTVPMSQGWENYEVCASERLWLAVEGAEHTMAYPDSDPAQKEALFAFLRAHMDGHVQESERI